MTAKAAHPELDLQQAQNTNQNFEHIHAADNVRLHVGNSYNVQQHHYVAAHDTQSGAKLQGGADAFFTRYLDALAFPQMDIRPSTIATAYSQTCQWLFEASQYMRWRDPAQKAEHQGFLWIKGKPGAGKFTLMKCALRHAQDSFDGAEETSASFFFNARGDRLETSSEGLYRALLYQIQSVLPLNMARNININIKRFTDVGWPLELLKDLLRHAIRSTSQSKHLTFYVDAVDEGSVDNDVLEMVEFFQELADIAISEALQLSVCLANRHYPKLSVDRCEELLLDFHQGHNGDIETYLRQKLRLKQSPLKDEMTLKIQHRAGGVFLWIVLVVGITQQRA